MNAKKQPKNLSAPSPRASTFSVLMHAVEECRVKPEFDYQRIVICLTDNSAHARKLACRCRAALVNPASPVAPGALSPVVILEVPPECTLETLESFVFLVNQTRTVMVLLVDRQCFFADWPRRWPCAFAKIRQRTFLTLEFGEYP